MNGKEKAFLIHLLSSSSESIENSQQAGTHIDSTVVKDILRSDHGDSSRTLMAYLPRTDAVPANSTSINNRIVSELEA